VSVRAALVALTLLLPSSWAGEPSAPVGLVRMEVKDVVPLQELKQHAVVLVAREDGSVLPLFVDETAAVAIAFRLIGHPTPHPLAQDLLDRLVKSLGGRLTEVRIDGVKDHIYTGHVVIQRANEKVVLEARPSDGVSMALSARAPIYVSRQVMSEAGITRSEIEAIGKGILPGTQPDSGTGGSGQTPRTPAPRHSPSKKPVQL
jgi:bifunctional DNase/RNase